MYTHASKTILFRKKRNREEGKEEESAIKTMAVVIKNSHKNNFFFFKNNGNTHRENATYQLDRLFCCCLGTKKKGERRDYSTAFFGNFYFYSHFFHTLICN